MKGFVKFGLFSLVILALIVWLGGFLGKKERLKNVERASQVVTGLGFEEVKQIEAYESYSGQIVANKRIELSTKIAGKVLYLDAIEGQAVSKGQVLAKIDASDLSAQAQAFEYQKVQAQKLELSARAQLEEAQKTFERYSALLKEGAITQQEFDQVKARLEAAKAQVEQTKAMQESANSQKMAIMSSLKYATLASPVSGIVVFKGVDIGDMAMPGQTLLIVESGPYMFEAHLPESLIGRLSLGQELEIQVPALGKNLKAQVAETSNHVDPATKTFKVKLKPTEQDGLKSGLYAKLFLKSSHTQLAIPISAIIKRFDFDAVWVLKPDKTLELRVVKLGEIVGELVQVQSGLNLGEKVVVSGKEKACQGCKVGD
ncbi:MAG: efflux RND transporter periplasmic adaptor subunit [Aquificaceae bacterium]|nr:efflux RND transporter periplasmic adaptor subunit [Aquificaceae bacterium]MDW8237676.1 efflux RND transporter periplasmic adaptor subunit [Aquificaceae bacterium]